MGGPILRRVVCLKYSVPIHGSLDTTFTEYVLPNLTLLFAFLLSIILTCFTFIYERKSGIFDRFLVSGVKLNQILVSHLLIQSLIVCIQAALMITLPNLILGYSSKGPIILLAILTLLQGFVGMTFGLFISSVTQSENTAINITNGVLYPLSFISGFFWPVEGMPYGLKFISYCTSLTLPSEAFRSVMSRGWNLSNLTVVYGFLVSIAWIIIHIVLTVFVLKFKK